MERGGGCVSLKKSHKVIPCYLHNNKANSHISYNAGCPSIESYTTIVGELGLHLSPAEESQHDTVMLVAHFKARRNIIFERAMFNQQQQEPGEKPTDGSNVSHIHAYRCNPG